MGWRNEPVNVEEWTELYIERRYEVVPNPQSLDMAVSLPPPLLPGSTSSLVCIAMVCFCAPCPYLEFSNIAHTLGRRPSLFMSIERGRNSTEFLLGFDDYLNVHLHSLTVRV